MSLSTDVKTMSVSDKAFWACIVLVAIIEAWNAALAEAPAFAATMPDMGLSAIWPFVPLTLLFVAAFIWLNKALHHPAKSSAPKNATVVRELSAIEQCFSTANWDAPLAREFRRTFVNETVDIDGKEFVECVFENVTFRFQGMQTCRFTNAKFVGVVDGRAKIRFVSDNAVVGQTLYMISELGLLKEKGDYELTSNLKP